MDNLVPRAELEMFTCKMVEEIAENAPLALKGIKRNINRLLQSVGMGEKDLLEVESIFEATIHSRDLKEGQLAFLKKRKPQFKGK